MGNIWDQLLLRHILKLKKFTITDLLNYSPSPNVQEVVYEGLI